MKNILLLLPVILSFPCCTYEKAELPKPDVTCVTDPVKHLVPVTMGDNYFNPQHIEILVGDTVKWTYSSGSEAHTSTCDGTNGSSMPSGATAWNSPVMSTGDVYTQPITVAGDYTYYCTLHGIMMSGTIHAKLRCQ